MRRETRTRGKRWIAGLIGLTLALGMVPAVAFANPDPAPAETQVKQVAVDDIKEPTGEPATPGSADDEAAGSADVEDGAAPRAAADNSLDVVYVSSDGNDGSGAGTQESPVASLAKAVLVAKDNGTVYVMSDLTMTKCARYYGKHLTITSGDGGPYTLTRGDNFAAHQDSARSTYNPALIEVDSTSGPNTASLKLINIVLDDAAKHEGSYFVQADSEGDGHTTVGSTEVGNTDIVQDGIIATYNGVATITLGDGAVLKNYGGMCAVRVSGGELIMEDGSQIIDDHEITREKGAEGSFGPAGAIWLQGGTLTMNGGIIGGADGTVMTGRAVYVDSGTANIGGTVQNIKGADAAWQGQNGVVVHLRSHGEATLTGTGEITNVTGTNSGNNCAIWTQFCNFTTKAGSVISHVDGFQLLHFDDLDNNNYSHEVLLDGTISDCACGSACLLRSWYGQITFGENSVIENCSSSSAGGLIYSNNGSHYTFKGTIRNNTASKGMIYLANQGGGGVIATIEDGAHIVDNEGLGIRVNNSSNLTMNGGEIARNSSYGVQISGKTDWTGVKFIMNGGTIADNGSYGIYHTVAGKSLVEINGGTVSGNKGLNDPQISSSGGYAVAEQSDAAGYEYTHVSAGTMSEPRTAYVNAGTVILPEGYADVNLGRATDAAVNVLKDAVNEDWTAVGSSGLWVQPSASEFSFKLDPISTPKKFGLFVAYVQVNPDGTPVDGAEVTVEEVENTDQVPITLKNLAANAPYAVMLFNNKEYTLAPDDITIYTGGGQGQETSDNGFPALTLTNCLDDIDTLVVDGQTVQSDDLMGELLKLLTVSYTDLNGDPVTNDSEPGEYVIKLEWANGQEHTIRINGNDVNPELGTGTLIVRHTENIDEAIDGTNIYPLATEEPTQLVANATAIANKDVLIPGILENDPEFYTNDDEDRMVDAKGIQILDDDLLIDEDGTDRQVLLEQKAVDSGVLPELGEAQAYRYDFHYLDLVDAYNGNAWVSASYGTTVYLPYPDGMTYDEANDITFTVVHYPELHREYGISGQAEVEEAIAACTPEVMTSENTPAGIKFDVEREGFSPFAIVWQTEAHTITATAGEGGTIVPEGAVIVAEGADKTFTMTPDEGYEIASITVDGAAVELAKFVAADGTASYTFTKVDRDHTIEVAFRSTGGADTPPYNPPSDPDPSDPSKPDIPVEKQLDGRDLVAGEFSFTITATGSNAKNVSPKSLTGRNDAQGNVTFTGDGFTFEETGTYTFTVAEKLPSDDDPDAEGVQNGGVTYDESTYTLTAKVTKGAGDKLAVSWQAPERAISFRNSYEPSDSVDVSLGATKVLEGRDLKAGEFTFELRDRNGALVATAKNAADGSVSFAALHLTEPGTYTYTITEVKGDLEGVTYYTSTHTVVITVIDNGDGTLTATVSYDGGDELPVFTNSYEESTEPGKPSEPAEPGRPSEPGKPSGGKPGASIPQTGDAVVLAVGGVAVAAVAAIGAGLYLRRRSAR